MCECASVCSTVREKEKVEGGRERGRVGREKVGENEITEHSHFPVNQISFHLTRVLYNLV